MLYARAFRSKCSPAPPDGAAHSGQVSVTVTVIVAPGDPHRPCKVQYSNEQGNMRSLQCTVNSNTSSNNMKQQQTTARYSDFYIAVRASYATATCITAPDSLQIC